MIVGCYTLDLYCDNDVSDHCRNVFSETYVGETFAECIREARSKGWIINPKKNKALCPECSGKG